MSGQTIDKDTFCKICEGVKESQDSDYCNDCLSNKMPCDRCAQTISKSWSKSTKHYDHLCECCYDDIT